MRTLIRKFFVVLLIVTILFSGVNISINSAKVSAAEEKKDILFIGNSMTYYNTLCKVMEGIATKKGHSVSCTEATTGGKNLIYHATADNVLEALKAGGYEVVVVQDVVGSFDRDKLLEGAKKLVAVIKQYNPNAQIVFYEPWPVESTLTCEYSLMPYFTEAYIEAAKAHNALLAPAGETFYDVYLNDGLNYYCGDEKHPKPLGTFVSAATIYYTIFEEEHIDFVASDQTYLDKLINDNVAYTNEGVEETYSIDTLNLIMKKAHYHANAAKVDDYKSMAGDYKDPDAGLNPNNLPSIKGKEVGQDFFTKDTNMALGCKVYASDEKQKPTNVTDGDMSTRWETEYYDPHWIYVDLGGVKTIKTVGVSWEAAYASKYYIQISNDATNWETVSVVNADKRNTSRITLDKTYSARYVRVYGTKRGTSYGYSIYEIGVWGEDEAFVTVKDTKIKKATKERNSKKAKVVLKKIKGATRYQIEISTSKKFKKSKIMTFKKNKFTVKNLKKNTKYYIRARVYKKVNGNIYYGNWTNRKNIKLK